MSNGNVDGLELAQRTRGQAFDIRTDADIPLHLRRKNPAANTLGRWRTTWTWNPATERAEMTAMVDTASAAQVSGTAGP